MTTFNPKFLTANYITNTSQLTLSSANTTNNKLKLFDRNIDTVSRSSNQTSGTRTITWTPSTSMSVSRIYLKNINWDTFTIKYNTSSNFSPTISYSSNTDTNIYIEVTPQAVSNIVFSITVAMSEPAELRTGEIYIGTELFELDTYSGYNTEIIPWHTVKMVQLSDGTSKKLYIRRGVDYSIDASLVSATERDKYLAVYNVNRTQDIVYIPLPRTGTDKWDGHGGHVVWSNAFDFENFTRNIEANGYTGRVMLSQSGGI